MKAAAVFLTLSLSLGVLAQNHTQPQLETAVAAGLAQSQQQGGQANPSAEPGAPQIGGAEPQPSAPAGPVTVTRVRVSISAYPEILEVIQPYLLEPLHERGDIQLAQDDAEWSIEIVATPLLDDEQNVTRVGLSFVIQQHGPHMEMMLALAQACRYFVATGYLSGQDVDYQMRRLLRGVEVVPKPKALAVVAMHRMAVVQPENLAQACRDIVTSFREERAKAEAPSSAAALPSERITGPAVARK